MVNTYKMEMNWFLKFLTLFLGTVDKKHKKLFPDKNKIKYYKKIQKAKTIIENKYSEYKYSLGNFLTAKGEFIVIIYVKDEKGNELFQIDCNSYSNAVYFFSKKDEYLSKNKEPIEKIIKEEVSK